MSTPTNGSRLKAAAAERAQQAQQPGNGNPPTEVVATRGGQIQALFDKNRSATAAALPSHMNVDRMIRVGLTVIRRTPNLARCTDLSLVGALMVSAQLGLEPGPLGHCYWLPFKDGKASRAAGYDVYEVTWICGYKGFVDLGMRSGRMLDIDAQVVREKDHFICRKGLKDDLVFEKCREGDRGEMTDVYMLAHFKDGGYHFNALTRHEVYENHRRHSKAYANWVKNGKKGETPWVNNEERMWAKSAIRSESWALPLSPEMAAAIGADEQVHRYEGRNFDLDLLADRVVDEDVQDAAADGGEPDRDPDTGEVIPDGAGVFPSEADPSAGPAEGGAQ